MRNVLYTLWFAIPIMFYLIALWGWLESLSSKTKKKEVAHYISQGNFVFACVLFSVAVDQYFLENLLMKLTAGAIPLGVGQVLLLPLILVIGARLVGPTKDVLISKAPKTGQSRKNKFGR